MEGLKAEIEKKRQLAMERASQPQNKYRKKGDVNRERVRELMEQQQLEQLQQSAQNQKRDAKSNESADLDDYTTTQLPKGEVVRRLRSFGEPITLFGEGDLAREKRMRQIEATRDTEFTEGQRNEFKEAIEQIEEGEDNEEAKLKEEAKKKKARRDGGGEGKSMQDAVDDALALEQVKELEKDGKDVQNAQQKEENKLDKLYDEQKKNPTCREHEVLFFFQGILKLWQSDLAERTDQLKRTAQGKAELAKCRITARYIRPLFRLLRKREIDADMFGLMYQLVRHLKDREYVMANNKYFEIAIGNSPWPIGVTMVGIHERSAREKIFSNQVAHVLNDECQRKYIQAMKRLMTYCQQKFPVLPSKMIG
mmetsp:Transcript_10154/g.25439  ORF Transcript_10154/g.25439 Transcript_10154/m.25439 type:complete len:366 (-) Transcript_10154:154-1251(-)